MAVSVQSGGLVEIQESPRQVRRVGRYAWLNCVRDLLTATEINWPKQLCKAPASGCQIRKSKCLQHCENVMLTLCKRGGLKWTSLCHPGCLSWFLHSKHSGLTNLSQATHPWKAGRLAVGLLYLLYKTVGVRWWGSNHTPPAAEPGILLTGPWLR